MHFVILFWVGNQQTGKSWSWWVLATLTDRLPSFGPESNESGDLHQPPNESRLLVMQAMQPKLEALEEAWSRLHTITGADNPEKLVAYWQGSIVSCSFFVVHLKSRSLPHHFRMLFMAIPAPWLSACVFITFAAQIVLYWASPSLCFKSNIWSFMQVEARWRKGRGCRAKSAGRGDVGSCQNGWGSSGRGQARNWKPFGKAFRAAGRCERWQSGELQAGW